MTAGNIPTIRCDYTDDADDECDQEWHAPVSMPHHRALRAWLRAHGWRQLRDDHAHRSSTPTATRPQGRAPESKATT
ncbi:hypothetical protein ACIGN6_31860 [Streptomyces sp. NPDC053792]|uniref:hypothetical protein n=1 Tax=Streptomyces sp. NPDC053792 TaxID=3365716 RepID=UPI0037D82449